MKRHEMTGSINTSPVAGPPYQLSESKEGELLAQGVGGGGGGGGGGEF